MNSAHAVATVRSLVVRNTIGGVITLLGAAGILGGAAMAGTNGRLLVGGGTFLALIGVIILIPLLSRPVIALVRPLLRRLFGVSGKLAAQNAVRNPGAPVPPRPRWPSASPSSPGSRCSASPSARRSTR